MFKSQKLKILTAVVLFFAISFAGTLIEKYEKDKFVVETVTSNEDYDGRLNINTAPVEDLVYLHGIGEKLAAKIVLYREENGPFETIEELAKISGISDNMVKNMADKICVE